MEVARRAFALESPASHRAASSVVVEVVEVPLRMAQLELVWEEARTAHTCQHPAMEGAR
jgi:hypothetical protein